MRSSRTAGPWRLSCSWALRRSRSLRPRNPCRLRTRILSTSIHTDNAGVIGGTVDALPQRVSSPTLDRRRASMKIHHLALACVLAFAAIPAALAQDTQRLRTDKVEVVVETFARGLQNPWSLAFLPDNRML